MKYIIAVIFAAVVLTSCKTEKIEIIPDYNSDYYASSVLDAQPKINSNEKDVQSEILGMVAASAGKYNKEVYYFFNVKLYIDKIGKIERIQYQKEHKKIKDTNALVNPDIHELFKKFTKYFESASFSPGKLDDNAVPARLEFEGEFKVSNSKAEYIRNSNIGAVLEDKAFDKSVYFDSAEELPQPVGGIAAIQEKIHYPESAEKSGIEGRVFVNAYVDENGDVKNVEVIKGIGSGCDEAAMKAVKETKFIPGKLDGETVKTQIAIPILFTMK